MHNTRYAKNLQDKNEAIALWQECFEDQQSYIDFYFEKRYQDQQFLLCENDEGKTVGGLHQIPYDFSFCGNIEKTFYLEAVGVKEEFRRTGIMNELLKKTFDVAREKNMREIFLKPRNPEVYEKFGFGFSHVLEKYEIEFDELESFSKKNKENSELDIIEMNFENSELIKEFIIYFNYEMKKNCRSFIEKNFDGMKFFLEEFYHGQGKFYILKNKTQEINQEAEEHQNKKESQKIFGCFGCFPQKNSVEVRELFFSSQLVFENICNFIFNSKGGLNKKSKPKNILFTTKRGTDLESYFPNRLKVVKTLDSNLMTRIIDVKTAISNYFGDIDYSIFPKQPRHIMISIIDNFIPENSGIYKYDFASTTITFFPSQKIDDYDIELNVSDLVSLLYHVENIETLVTQNRLRIKNVGIRNSLIYIFFRLRESYINEIIL
ncbi:MAG: GNAT family N-acetyltransferase [Fusobacteriaceae bacterium]